VEDTCPGEETGHESRELHRAAAYKRDDFAMKPVRRDIKSIKGNDFSELIVLQITKAACLSGF
jgi:hypothetical protein